MTNETWSSAERYERFMGRCSRPLAVRMLSWLDPPSGLRWVDVGCGTGALTTAILDRADPASVLGVDPSDAYVALASAQVTDDRATFRVGTATQLPVTDESVDRVASGLVLNFVPDAVAAVREMRRVLVPGGVATAYVWDYAEGMQMLRLFWNAAIAEDPAAADLDEGTRFGICAPGGLADCFRAAGLVDVTATEVEIPTDYRDFDDYWLPFLGGQGAAGQYCATLSDEKKDRLRVRLRDLVPAGEDGTITLRARARVAVGAAPWHQTAA